MDTNRILDWMKEGIKNFKKADSGAVNVKVDF